MIFNIQISLKFCSCMQGLRAEEQHKIRDIQHSDSPQILFTRARNECAIIFFKHKKAFFRSMVYF